MVSTKEFRIVYCNCFNSKKALEIGRALVNSRLAACINVVKGEMSVYHWDKNIEEDEESILVIKTHISKLNQVEKMILDMHNFDVPEIISTDIKELNESYMKWMIEAMEIEE